jgi:hypothetical protein
MRKRIKLETPLLPDLGEEMKVSKNQSAAVSGLGLFGCIQVLWLCEKM